MGKGRAVSCTVARAPVSKLVTYIWLLSTRLATVQQLFQDAPPDTSVHCASLPRGSSSLLGHSSRQDLSPTFAWAVLTRRHL